MNNSDRIVDEELKALFDSFAPEVGNDSEFTDALMSKVDAMEHCALLSTLQERERKLVRESRIAVFVALVVGAALAVAAIAVYTLVPHTILSSLLAMLPTAMPFTFQDWDVMVLHYIVPLAAASVALLVTYVCLRIVPRRNEAWYA